jgi:hypothetical protein
MKSYTLRTDTFTLNFNVHFQVGEAASFEASASTDAEFVAFAAAKLTNNPQRAGMVNVVVPEGVNKMVVSDGVTLQAGAVYYREPVGVQSGFTTSFTVEYV